MPNFDLDLKEAQQVNEVYAAPSRSNDRRICICGHAISRHRTRIFTQCQPGALSCPCVQPRPVVRVPNTRYFMRKTLGSGVKHALIRGVAASMEALGAEEFEANSEWLVPEECDSCHKPSGYFPVLITKEAPHIPLLDDAEDQGAHAFLCAECRSSMPSIAPVADLPPISDNP